MPDPQVIGKYRIEGSLGQGGMGAVYLARDPRIGRLVALKVLRLDNQEMRNRFELEAQSAGRLKHPNIVTIYDYEEYDGNPCLAMEYVEGHTLAEIIQRRDPLSISQRLDFIEQVCRGLAYAHAAGIVHRDIKPSNLMVDQHGVVKILDFGIARNAERGLTRSHRMVGTAGYMSPEQVRGDKVDNRCDVFAVGLVLYEFLTGQRAFPGENEYSVFDRILNGSPEPFGHPDARVLRGVGPIIETALARLPADRYPTATALGAAVAAVRGQFEAGADSNATFILPAATTPPPLVDSWHPKTPKPLSPDETPTREPKRFTPRSSSPALVAAEPAAALVAERPRSKRSLLAAVTVSIIVAGVLGVRFGWPLLNASPVPVSSEIKASPSESNAPAVIVPASGNAVAQPLEAPPVGSPQPAASSVVDSTASTLPAATPPTQPAVPRGNPKPELAVPTAEARRTSAQRVAEGQKAFDDGDYDAAIKAYEAALAQDATDRRARDGILQARKAKVAEEAILQRKSLKPPQ